MNFRISLSNRFYDYENFMIIERFYSRDQQPYWITETKETICIKIEVESQRISLVCTHHHGRHSFVFNTNMAAVTSCENAL